MAAAAPDPWVVTAGERVKHEEQFKGLSAGSGMVSGDAAKKFFLQSRLPPQVLGVIWFVVEVECFQSCHRQLATDRRAIQFSNLRMIGF